MMKILHTIASLGAHSGGTSTCTYELLRALHARGVHADCLALRPRAPGEAMLGEGEPWLRALPDDGVTPLRYSRNMSRFLREADYDLYHTNGLWMHCNHETCAAARRQARPYVVTPHGMLYPQAMARSAWKKRLMLALGHRRDLEAAACLHVTCEEEMRHCRELGLKRPIAVVPNPVTMPACIGDIARRRERFRIGFLGRLHPRKHVHDLIAAWISLGDGVRDGELLIVGGGDESYVRRLRRQAVEAGNVRFSGFLSGREKYEALASMSALFVPSDFENFGMIVPEALSVGTPVAASLATPWKMLETARCGWWRANDRKTLAALILEIKGTPEPMLTAMGQRGIKLVRQNYLPSVIASTMVRLYRYILNGGGKPEFVYE